MREFNVLCKYIHTECIQCIHNAWLHITCVYSKSVSRWRNVDADLNRCCVYHAMHFVQFSIHLHAIKNGRFFLHLNLNHAQSRRIYNRAARAAFSSCYGCVSLFSVISFKPDISVERGTHFKHQYSHQYHHGHQPQRKELRKKPTESLCFSFGGRKKRQMQ